MRSNWRFGAMMVTLAACAMSAAAQDEKGLDPLADLRLKDALGDEERGKIGTWVDTQINAVQSGELAGSSAAITAVRESNRGSAAFREAYAGQVIRAVSAAYKGAKKADAARLITALNSLNEPMTYTVLVEALKSEDISVRYAAAAGLRNLRAKIAVAGGKYFAESLDAIRQAAANEPVRLILATLYDAMNYPEVAPSPPEPKSLVEALLSVLDARAQAYAAGAVKAEGAEVQGLKVASAMRPFMNDADKKRFSAAAGRLLLHAVRRYVTAELGGDGVRLPPQLRRDTELLVIEAEKGLKETLSPAGGGPNVTKAMEKVNFTDMKIEFNKWSDLLKKSADVDLKLEVEPSASQPGEGG